jgi:hypothetical protein
LNGLPPAPQGAIDLAAHDDDVAMTWGTNVVRFRSTQGLQVMPLSGAARSIAVGTVHGRAHFIAGLEDCGVLIRPGDDIERFGDGLIAPLLRFTRGGMIVAADATEGRTYRAEQSVTRAGRFDVPGGKTPLALTPTDQLHGFALFTNDGNVQVFQIPR